MRRSGSQAGDGLHRPGVKEKWGDAFVFDSILLEEGGPAYYVQLYKGEIDVANDPVYRAALEKFAQLAPYFNADHSALTWDQAVGLVGAEQAAMTLMGTWAIGAFTKGSNWEPGVDFGAVTFPQVPERILLFHPDTYGITVKAPDPAATMDWLGSGITQIADSHRRDPGRTLLPHGHRPDRVPGSHSPGVADLCTA
ncbi:MAG: extracellular solute-binding protein [Caldilineaceae bacterium]